MLERLRAIGNAKVCISSAQVRLGVCAHESYTGLGVGGAPVKQLQTQPFAGHGRKTADDQPLLFTCTLQHSAGAMQLRKNGFEFPLIKLPPA